jgi:hypothetical protein
MDDDSNCGNDNSYAAVVAIATAMTLEMAVTIAVVAVTKTTVATAMAGGIDNNLLKGAVEEKTVVATVTAVETAKVTEMTLVIATITMVTPSLH